MLTEDVYVGVDLGGTHMRAARVVNGKIVKPRQIPTPKHAESEIETINLLIDLIASVLTKDVRAIGVGVPSVVNRTSGIVYNVTNIPHWEEVHLKEILEKHFSLPVFIDNDANCFALGQRYFGDGQLFENFVGLTIGTGLGAGIIQQGSLLKDANCRSGEFGLLPYKDQTLEYYCSGLFFENVYGRTGRYVYRNALKSQTIPMHILKVFGSYLADAIKMIVLTIDPQMIVIGGSVAEAHLFFEKSMYQGLEDFPYPNSIKNLQIRFSTLEHAGILGAASLCY